MLTLSRVASKTLHSALNGGGGGTPPSLFASPSPPATARPIVSPSASSSLVTAQAALETTDLRPPAWLRAERYGSADHDDFAPSEPGEAVYRHAGWAADRRRVYESLLRTGASCRRVANFMDCGGTLWLMADGSEPSLSCNKCHDRLCLPCQRERQAEVIEAVLLRCHEAQSALRFATLTLKHRDLPLGPQIDRLLSSFKLLRNHPTIAPAMKGGVWFLEVKLDKAGNLWHPHLHVIVEGDFISQHTLGRCWHEVTGDSFMVDIRAVNDVRKRARYVTKYSTKPLHFEVTRIPAKLDHFMEAIKGRRLYQCFGTWSKAVRRTKPAPRKLVRVGHVSDLHSRALAGDADALRWMRIAHGRWPALRKAFPIPAGFVPPEVDPP